MKIIGNKIYDICSRCGKLICLNKRLFGSLHFCSTDEELQNLIYRKALKQIYEQRKKALEEKG